LHLYLSDTKTRQKPRYQRDITQYAAGSPNERKMLFRATVKQPSNRDIFPFLAKYGTIYSFIGHYFEATTKHIAFSSFSKLIAKQIFAVYSIRSGQKNNTKRGTQK